MNRTKILLTIFLLSLSIAGASQKKLLYFDVVRNGNKVGRIVFSEMLSGKMDSLKLELKVHTKLIWTFNALVKETAVFNDGILVESSIYRQLNGTEKANKWHKVNNGK